MKNESLVIFVTTVICIVLIFASIGEDKPYKRYLAYLVMASLLGWSIVLAIAVTT